MHKNTPIIVGVRPEGAQTVYTSKSSKPIARKAMRQFIDNKGKLWRVNGQLIFRVNTTEGVAHVLLNLSAE